MGAWQFDGVDDRFVVTHGADINTVLAGANGFTVGCWIKRTAAGGADNRIVNKAAGSAAGTFNLTESGTDSLRMRCVRENDGAAPVAISANSFITADSTWKVVFGTWLGAAAATVACYKVEGGARTTGAVTDTTAASPFTRTNTADLTIGAQTDGGGAWAGFIAYVGIWDHILTEVEMEDFQTGTLKTTGLAFWWQLDDSATTQPNEGSVSGFDAAATGATWNTGETLPVTYGGAGTVEGTAAGTYGYGGAATGQATVTGSASGAYGHAGTAASETAVSGSAAGVYTYSGTATAPTELTGLTATPVSSTQIDLEWDPYPGASGYDIEIDDITVANDVQGTTYEATGLDPDTEYKFRVGAVLGAAPFITATEGSGTASYFVDQYSDPILVRGYVLWGLLTNAGRWGGGTTWQSDLENAVAGLEAMGVNALYTAALGSLIVGGANNDGSTWDDVFPFTGGDPATLNDTYWERSDYLFDLCAAAGITVFFNLAYSDDLENAALSAFTTADFTDYGTSVAARYKTRPNLVWMVGGDYFDNFNTDLTALLAAIRTEGDTHLFGVQNYPESTSRRDIENNNLLNTGNDNADFNFVYSYNTIYWGIEYGYTEASPIPVLWGDGHFDQDSVADRKVMRDLVWWALSSGARGTIYGSEGTWTWGSSALANLTSDTFPNTDQPTIWDTFAALDGWHLLVPDTDDSLLTAGRGAKGDYVTGSGGTGGEYNASDPQDQYVTAAVNAAGTLAVVYFPVDQTITVDDTELAGGYTARWVDPADGSSTPTSTGSSYSPAGTNSLGGPDWLLVLEA